MPKGFTGNSTSDSVRALLKPQSIAVVGASSDPRRLGGIPLRLLQQRGYRDRLYPVNPNHEEIGGLPSYSSVEAIPDDIDLALICVQSSMVPDAVDACGRKGVKVAYVMTSGFEGGPQGSELNRQLREVVARWPLRLVGPNGLGVFNVHDDIAATFNLGLDLEQGWAPSTRAGNIAVISQSGGLGFGIFEYGEDRGLGFSYVISAGNEMDIEVADFLEYFLEDSRTKVVLLFVEGFQTPARIVSLLPRYLEREKALVVAKMGKSEEGRLASVSHTAHVAGPTELYSALFRRFGVYEADDVTDMLDAAAAFSHCDAAGGDAVGIVTGTGGSGVWLAEACVARGLRVPELEPERQKAILASLPYFAAARNPVDVTAAAAAGKPFFDAIGAVAASPEVDAVAFIGVGPHLMEQRSLLSGVVAGADRPILAYAHHPPAPEVLDFMGDMGLPCYLSPMGLANGMKALCQYGAALAGLNARKTTEDSPKTSQSLPAREGPADVVSEHEVKQWLRAAGLPVPEGHLVRAADEAADAARAIGYPVVLKLQSPSFPHKSNAGGVALGLSSESDLRAAYEQVVAAADGVIDDADVDGVLVESMASDGVEMMVGLETDPDLGAFVVLGAGGVLTEVIGDVVIAPAPMTETEVMEELRRLRCWPMLAGERGQPRRDVDAFCALVSRLSLLGQQLVGTIRELDLNPIIVHGPGEGATIVDGLAVWASTTDES